jgi:hypothetical protein
MTVPEYLRTQARAFTPFGKPPYRVNIEAGVRGDLKPAKWWFWIDADGNACPPPQTCFQPTVR